MLFPSSSCAAFVASATFVIVNSVFVSSPKVTSTVSVVSAFFSTALTAAFLTASKPALTAPDLIKLFESAIGVAS